VFSTCDADMMKSMTAYARSAATLPAGQIVWELRSVNQRYLDLSLRLPEEFRGLDAGIRSALKARLGRGKVEATLRYHSDPASAAARLALNTDLARSLLAAHDELAGLAGLDGRGSPPDLVRLLAWPGLIDQAEDDLTPEFERVMAALDEAVDDLVAARRQEGRAIADMIRPRLAGVREQVALVREQLPAIRAALEARFRERLAALDVDVEPGRIEQEIVLQLQKLDVDEELDRLDAHVAEVERVMTLDEPVGRRLDFLMQELNREANTLGSKATAAEVGQAAVELKVLIEQMREQVQNVE